MYAYCGNNPVMRVDPSGEAWYHWVIGAGIVLACAVAVIATAGGVAAGVCAVLAVAKGVAAATTASTIAASAFIGASLTYGAAAISAISTSHSVSDFNNQGNWGTVSSTVIAGAYGGAYGYAMARTQIETQSAFMPEDYYKNSKAPKIGMPNTSYNNVRYNGFTGKHELSTTYYDYAGRQSIRIDWTNHGRLDHGNPHIHFTFYSKQYPDGFTIRWD